jgi:hypothetical protein
MTEQKAAARKISSFVTPTEDDVAYFDSLSESEQRTLLRAELDRGIASGLSNKTFEEILAEARASLAPRRGADG